MKSYIAEFLKRGFMAAGGGPLIMAIVYAILDQCGVVNEVSVSTMFLAVISSFLMAFIAGAVTVIYMSERLPYGTKALIHGSVLFLDYFCVYLINGWIKGALPIAIFSASFIVGFIIISVAIYFPIKKQTEVLNRKIAEEKA